MQDFCLLGRYLLQNLVLLEEEVNMVSIEKIQDYTLDIYMLPVYHNSKVLRNFRFISYFLNTNKVILTYASMTIMNVSSLWQISFYYVVLNNTSSYIVTSWQKDRLCFGNVATSIAFHEKFWLDRSFKALTSAWGEFAETAMSS